MAIDLWNDDDEEFSGEYVQEGGGDFPVIPHDTRVKACIDKVLWENKTNYKNNKTDEDCISMRFDIEEGEFKGQKIFKKFFINSGNDEQATKDYRMFLNIDANAGGKIRALRREPENDDLSRCLINKSMIIVVGMMKDKETKKEQNYLMGVSSGKNKPESKPSTKSRTATSKHVDLDESEDIPF